MAGMMSSHAEKCCHLVGDKASSLCLCSSWSIVHSYLFLKFFSCFSWWKSLKYSRIIIFCKCA